MTDKVLVERDGPVTIITINRPKSKNALDNEAAHALADALQAFDADPGCRVAVLTGAGGAFCAGADLKELGSGVDYFPWAGSDHGPLRAPLSKPVIAAIEGHACAGGLGVALFCDIRIVDDTAVGADEALAIGLATRKVARGTTRAEAEKLAHQIAGFPPIAMTSDRQSAYESFDRNQQAAIRREMELSLEARRQESQKGAARFAQGEGRHGKFKG